MQSKTARWTVTSILVLAALVLGYILGGFVAMVVLIVGGAAWWTLTTFAIGGVIAGLACLWLWKHRSSWVE